MVSKTGESYQGLDGFPDSPSAAKVTQSPRFRLRVRTACLGADERDRVTEVTAGLLVGDNSESGEMI
jgi:hypothetical protein